MGQKGSSTKQKICEVAEKLFAENGYKNVSMQDICDSSGMSKGGIYRHFSSKSELLLSLLQKEKRVFQDIQEGKSATETLENLLKIYFEDMKNCKKSLAFALYEFASTENKITLDITKMALKKLNVDESGLNEMDYKYLQTIIERYKGGPVGLNAVAASIGEEVLTLEDVCEPYLLQAGFLQRTPRGRKVSPEGYRHLGIKDVAIQGSLFDL